VFQFGKKECLAVNCLKNLGVSSGGSNESSGKHALSGAVEVDEFLVGGFSEGERGRTHGSKDLVVLAIEKVTDKKGKITIGRAYCRVIDDASADSLKKIFDERIAPQASIKTDGWRGYWPLGKDWNITKEKSDKGAGLQQYLDEYHLRFNRRGFMNSIFDKLISKMTEAKPVNLQNDQM